MFKWLFHILKNKEKPLKRQRKLGQDKNMTAIEIYMAPERPLFNNSIAFLKVLLHQLQRRSASLA